jgi:predicted Zn-dependent protease
MTNYQKAIDLTPDPLIMIRAGRVMLAANKPDDAITWFDKAASAPNSDARVKQIAAQDKSRATQMKNAHPAGSPPPGSPSASPSTAPAPQQIQVKPPQP